VSDIVLFVVNFDVLMPLNNLFTLAFDFEKENVNTKLTYDLFLILCCTDIAVVYY